MRSLKPTRPVGRALLACAVATGLALCVPLLAAGAPAEMSPRAAPASVRLGTFLGARSADVIRAVAADATGIYVLGDTYSDDLGGFGGALQGRSDLFVARVSPSGDGLVWGAYLGGGANETAGGIALDGRGGVWVVGSSNSTDFPTTAAALQGQNNGGYDAVIAELDAASGELRYGSYFGEEGSDEARGIAADTLGHILITGQGGEDVMALRLNAESYRVAYAGYFGGTGEDGGHAVAAGPRGYAFITGATDGPGSTVDFPLINPLQPRCGLATDAGSCGQDAFVSAITPDGELVYSTLLGGGFAGSEISSGADTGRAIAVDAAGNILVAGETYAGDFPTSRAFQASRRGADNIAEGFLAKISADGERIVYATYLGGSQADDLRALAVDAQGNAYVAGFSGSRDFPVKDALQPQLGDGVCGLGGSERFCEDAVVAKVGPDGALAWSTYLGGGLDDYGYGLALDGAGDVLIVGSAASSAGQGFPVTAGALQTGKGLSSDGFIVRLGGAAPQPQPQPQPQLPFRVNLPLLMS